MRAVVRPARVVRHSAAQSLMSKRSASRSSDREVMRYLSRSQIFKDYEGAFGEAMGLPLSGFQSMTNFNRAFRRIVGRSPTQFRESLPKLRGAIRMANG